MSDETSSLTAERTPMFKRWQGLGIWNLYFLFKFALLWAGYLNFHPLENLVFLAFLLMPLPSHFWYRLRFWAAIPIGFALFWYDTWLPGLNRITAQRSQVLSFDFYYVTDLVGRFINWDMVGIGFVLIIGYLFISQWIRVTVFVTAALLWLNILTFSGPAVSLLPESKGQPAITTKETVAAESSPSQLQDNLPPTRKNLDAYLASFYAEERDRFVDFPAALPGDAVPFDILIIHICSLSWSDIRSVQLDTHPIWQHFDIMFDNFNSVTSYSGPASLRLLRASCGQVPHKDLYSPAKQQCYLFDNLSRLGFAPELILDHAGTYGNYLDIQRQHGGLVVEPRSQEGVKPELDSFDGGQVMDGVQMLVDWQQEREGTSGDRSAAFINVTPLHDGHRFIGEKSTAPYQARATTLLDKLDRFIDSAEKSGRKILLIVLPEHGAALVGDKMQISGLRDIPSPSMTHVPVGIKLINMNAPKPNSQIHVPGHHSYLAIAEIISRLLDGKAFTEDSFDWNMLVQNLPETPFVRENTGSVVIDYQNDHYVSLNNGSWIPYPDK